jgi:hypothetical protein
MTDIDDEQKLQKKMNDFLLEKKIRGWTDFRVYDIRNGYLL